jgi:hypothetical protein
MLLRYGRLAWRSGQGCFSAKTRPRASQRCVRCSRGPSGERESSGVGCLCPRLDSGEAGSCPLSGLNLDLNRVHQVFAVLCWWGLSVETRSLGGTHNYGLDSFHPYFLELSRACFSNTTSCYRELTGQEELCERSWSARGTLYTLVQQIISFWNRWRKRWFHSWRALKTKVVSLCNSKQGFEESCILAWSEQLSFYDSKWPKPPF